MADVSIGEIRARLTADAAEFIRNIQAALASLQQLSQALQGLQGPLNQFQQALSQATVPAQQLNQTFNQLNQTFHQANQTFNQTNQTFNQLNQTFHQANQTFNQTNQTFNQLNQTVNQFTQTNQTFNTTLNQTIITINQAREASQGLGDIWSRVFSIAGALGLTTSIEGAIRAVRVAVTDFAESLVEVGTRMEGLRLGFQALFGGQAGGARAFEQLTNFAQRFGIELSSLTDTYRRFAAATRGTALEGQRGQTVFESFMQAGTAVGSSQAQLNQLGLAIEQMVSKGVVSMEELRRQMGNALPGAFQIAARAMGTTTEELDKLIRKGHTEAIPFLEAMARQLRTEFGPAAENAATGAAAAFNRLGNEILLFKDMLANSGLIQWLRDLNNGIADVLKSVRELRQEREQTVGGPPPTVPSFLQQSPEVLARQREIDALHASLLPQVEMGEMPDLSAGFARMGMTIEQATARLKALEAEQRKVIENSQRMLEAEAVPAMSAADPLRGVPERLRKIFEEGMKQLRDIDLSGQFLPALDVADEKLKSWEKTLKSIREEFGKLGPGIRQDLRPGGQPTPFDALITQLAGEQGIDPNLVKALVAQESSFRPGITSPKGAMGLMQLMPATAARYGAGAQPYDPETNLRAGIAYLADLLKQFGNDVNRALTAYNAGPGGGGIPQRTGENATFAQDVLRRIPGGALDVVQQAERMQEALRAGRESQTPDRERLAQIRATGKAYLDALEEQERQEEELARERRRQAMETGRVINQAYDEEAQKQQTAHAELTRLAAQYGMLKTARDAERASQLAQTLAMSAWSEEAQQQAQAIQDSITMLEKVPALRRQAQQSFEEFELLRGMRERLEQLQQPIGEGPFGVSQESVRARQRMARELRTPEAQEQGEQLQAQIERQERLLYGAQLFQQFGMSVGSAWTQALTGIADGTRTVSEAFREMGRSILQTMAQIASQEAFKALVGLGTRLIFGAALGGVGGGGLGGESPSAVGAGINPILFQHGGLVERPTFAMLGEAGPEYVVPRAQMQNLMSGALRAAPSAGGQAASGGVSIHNYPSREAAEQGANRDRANGKTAIVNAVMEDLGTGEASKINRMLRTMQR